MMTVTFKGEGENEAHVDTIRHTGFADHINDVAKDAAHYVAHELATKAIDLLHGKDKVVTCPDCALIMAISAFILHLTDVTHRPVVELVRIAADAIDSAEAEGEGKDETHH